MLKLKQYKQSLVNKALSQATIKSYLRQLQCLPPDPIDITVTFVDEYIQTALANKKDTKTINLFLSALRSYLKFLERSNTPSLSPSKIELMKIKHKKLNILSISDLNRMRAFVARPSNINNKRDLALIDTLYSTGLRLSELLAIKVKDVTTTATTTVPEQLSIQGKGGKLRIVFLDPVARDSLKRYLNPKNPPECPVFNITPRQVQRVIKETSDELELSQSVTPHKLRHLLATELIKNGADIKMIQELLGHSSIVTTEMYLHVSNPHLQASFTKYFGR